MKCKKCNKEFLENEDKIRVIREIKTGKSKNSNVSGFWNKETIELYHLNCYLNK